MAEGGGAEGTARQTAGQPGGDCASAAGSVDISGQAKGPLCPMTVHRHGDGRREGHPKLATTCMHDLVSFMEPVPHVEGVTV